MEDAPKKKENEGMTVRVPREWKESGGLGLRTGSDIELLVAGAGLSPCTLLWSRSSHLEERRAMPN